MAKTEDATYKARAPIERNLAMELVRVTEAAALAASLQMGKGDKDLVDQAAVDAMRFTLEGISMDGVVVIGEGEKDEAPMLYNGERIGDGSDPKVDIVTPKLFPKNNRKKVSPMNYISGNLGEPHGYRNFLGIFLICRKC